MKIKNASLSTTAAALLLSAAALSGPALAGETIQTEKLFLQADIMAEELQHPWAIAFLPDGAVLMTERPGSLRLLKGNILSDPLDGLPKVAAEGQGGLLDVAIAPDFATSGLIFFTFAEPGEGGAGTAVGRARLLRDDGTPRLEDVSTIFSMARKTDKRQHFGSRLVFSPDGTLFVTTGDRGDGPRAQDMQDHAGAVLRINTDGTIPAGNAFASPADGRPEIWSKGHRNLQGAIFDPVSKALITVEHGAKGGDELNQPQVRKNYGWPVISYGVDYSGAKLGVGSEAEGYEQPLHYWDPSIAPSGLASYTSDMFPEWKGDLLVGSLKFGLLSRLDRDAEGKIIGEERMFDGRFGRIRDVRVAPDGAVWLVTDENPGTLVRLSRAAGEGSM